MHLITAVEGPIENFYKIDESKWWQSMHTIIFLTIIFIDYATNFTGRN
jgi:hypothetical protein